MNQNIKIAKQLIKLAKDLIANNQIYFIKDKNDNIVEVDENAFKKIFNAKTASESNYYRTTRAEILISPVVNVTHPTSPVWYKDLIQKTKNWFSTLKNKANAEKIIYNTLDKSQTEQGLENRGFELGCSIIPQKGLYSTFIYKCNNCNDNFNEHELNGQKCPYCDSEVEKIKRKYEQESYSIIVYGATKEQIDKFAESLRDLFDQESVIVNFSKVLQDYKAI